jgi:translation elongation factor EF-Ts
MNPTYVSFESVSKDYIDKLSEEYRLELVNSGKPEAMINQILE